jgi:hypothetical protein
MVIEDRDRSPSLHNVGTRCWYLQKTSTKNNNHKLTSTKLLVVLLKRTKKHVASIHLSRRHHTGLVCKAQRQHKSIKTLVCGLYGSEYVPTTINTTQDIDASSTLARKVFNLDVPTVESNQVVGVGRCKKSTYLDETLYCAKQHAGM